MHAAGKMKRSPSPPVVERPGSEPLAPVDGRKGAAGLVWAMEGAEPRVGKNHVKKQLRVGSWAGSAQGPFPSALPGSITMRGTFSHRPDALSCHPQRGRPAITGHRDSHFRAKAWRWPAVMTPRRAALRANDVGASHRAADGAGPSIPGARTHAHGTSMGAAAAVSCIWSAFALKALGDSPIGHHRDDSRGICAIVLHCHGVHVSFDFSLRALPLCMVEWRKREKKIALAWVRLPLPSR